MALTIAVLLTWAAAAALIFSGVSATVAALLPGVQTNRAQKHRVLSFVSGGVSVVLSLGTAIAWESYLS